MVCVINCSIAVVFFVAMMYMCFLVDKDEITNNFKQSLNEEQKIEYNKIIIERRMIYIWGYLLGILFSVGYVLVFKPQFKNDFALVCFGMSVTFLVAYFFYILYPKRQLMVVGLDEKEDREKWAHVYKKMQNNYHVGLILGIIAAGFLSKSIKDHCKK